MLTTINFDDNFGLMTGKVCEVGTDGCLSPEVMLLEWRLPQMLP